MCGMGGPSRWGRVWTLRLIFSRFFCLQLNLRRRAEQASRNVRAKATMSLFRFLSVSTLQWTPHVASSTPNSALSRVWYNREELCAHQLAADWPLRLICAHEIGARTRHRANFRPRMLRGSSVERGAVIKVETSGKVGMGGGGGPWHGTMMSGCCCDSSTRKIPAQNKSTFREKNHLKMKMGFSRRALVLGAVLFGFSCFFWVFLVRQDDGEGEQEWRGAPSKKRGAKQMSCYLPATFRVFLFFIFWGEYCKCISWYCSSSSTTSSIRGHRRWRVCKIDSA